MRFISLLLTLILFYSCSKSKSQNGNIIANKQTIVTDTSLAMTSDEVIRKAKKDSTERIEINHLFTIQFQEFAIVFDSLEVWDNEAKGYINIQKTKNDTTFIFPDLGYSLEGNTFELKNFGDFKDVKIEQAYQTSMSIQGEGPHYDLSDWKHYNSEWITLKPLPLGKYLCATYSDEDTDRFPKVTLEEVKSQIQGVDRKEWLSFLSTEYPYGSVMISHYFLKISGINKKTGQKIVKIVVFEMPMGC
jgi:hypothetical protein